MTWKESLKTLCENSLIKESEILHAIPYEHHSVWDDHMRGKTCPIDENGNKCVYGWDLEQFLERL